MLRALRYVVLCLPLLAAGAAVAGSTQPAGTTQAAEDTVTSTTFVVRGRGWGHGVGMGQWGAYGQAKRGVRYKKILAHYYPGTKLVETRTSSVRILLAEGQAQSHGRLGGPVPAHGRQGRDPRPGAGELRDEPRASRSRSTRRCRRTRCPAR